MPGSDGGTGLSAGSVPEDAVPPLLRRALRDAAGLAVSVAAATTAAAAAAAHQAITAGTPIYVVNVLF